MLSKTRNFCIIAHIDHGKSTLADRIMQLTQSVDERVFQDQLLDSMDLERERGITIKSHPVSMSYTAKDGETYLLNLIDTPGHVDFSYEVSRSMAACEAAILLIDAAQGVQAQTVANTYLALENELEIIPVLNKIDLPGADIEGVKRQVEEALAIPMDDCSLVSSKTGLGVEELLEVLIQKVPPPQTEKDGPLRAVIFDSVYDVYRGVIAYVRVVDGTLHTGDSILYMGTNTTTEVKEVGVFSPEMKATASLSPGMVGYVIGTVKDPENIRTGDTVTLNKAPAKNPLPGFRKVRPMVFSGLYPVSSDEYEKVRTGLEKLQLNDAAFTWHSESSVALGFGFRCGFLGLLHMEIVQERLRREFDCDIISTHPAVVYRIHYQDGKVEEIDNPTQMPDDPMLIDHIEEPMIKATIITPTEFIGEMMRIVMEHRGVVEKTDSLDGIRVILTCLLPLNEILVDFNDKLKSVSRGYASMDYDYFGYQESDIVRMDILLNGEIVDAFSCMVHRDRAVSRGRQICAALKESIPPHMFKIPVQAAIGRTIIAREDIRAFRKDVTAKLYGGDVTRKQKLLKKQKEGKKRMKQCGTVNVPQDAFISVLRGSSNT